MTSRPETEASRSLIEVDASVFSDTSADPDQPLGHEAKGARADGSTRGALGGLA